jgi:hypothetical protein
MIVWWTLSVFIAYQGSGTEISGVAMERDRYEFATQEECEAAKRTIAASLDNVFKRVGFSGCFKRTYPTGSTPTPSKASSMKD